MVLRNWVTALLNALLYGTMYVYIRTYICSVYMCKTQLQAYSRPHTFGTMWNDTTSACVPHPHPTPPHIYIYIIHMHIRTLYTYPHLPLPSACMADHMTVRWPLTAVPVHPLLMHARIIEHQAKMQKLYTKLCNKTIYTMKIRIIATVTACINSRVGVSGASTSGTKWLCLLFPNYMLEQIYTYWQSMHWHVCTHSVHMRVRPFHWMQAVTHL